MHFQNYPLYLTVFALQFAKSSILWNPVIFVLLNKTVSIVDTYLELLLFIGGENWEKEGNM